MWIVNVVLSFAREVLELSSACILYKPGISNELKKKSDFRLPSIAAFSAHIAVMKSNALHRLHYVCHTMFVVRALMLMLLTNCVLFFSLTQTQ